MGPIHIVSEYHKEGPGDGSLPFPWKPTTMLSLDPDINEAKEIILDPPVRCLHKLTGDRREVQPKGPCNLASDYHLVPRFESMEDREMQIILYALHKEGIRLLEKTGEVVIAHAKDIDGHNCNEHDDESWSDDGISHDWSTKKKRFQWQPQIKFQGDIVLGKREAESRSNPNPPNQFWKPEHIHVVMTGGVDPMFKPSVGDIVLVPPKRQVTNFRIVDGACVMTIRESDKNFVFKAGDLVMCLGRYVQPPLQEGRRRRKCPQDPPILYDPFASVTLYRYGEDEKWRLMGCHQKNDLCWVPLSHEHLYSAGKELGIGERCQYGIVTPRRGDIIIRQGAWEENFDHHTNYRRSLVKWWTPRFQFRYGITQGTVLIRPFVDRMRRTWTPKEEPHFYWGRLEMYVYRGSHARHGWKYWGMDDHICDMPPFEPPCNVFHYVEDTDVDTDGPESEFCYRQELCEVWGKPGTFFDIQRSGYPL